MKNTGIIILILFYIFSLTEVQAWNSKKLNRSMKYFKKELLLKCPDFIREKHEKITSDLIEKLNISLSDKKLDYKELNDFSWDYAVVLDKLKTCNRKTIDKSLKRIFHAADVEREYIDKFFDKSVEYMNLIKKRRDDRKTAAGILTKYGLGKQVSESERLLKKERTTGFATSAKSGKINKMVDKYFKVKKKKKKTEIRTSFDD